MRLNSRYRRNIKADLSFYIAATLLTAVTLFMFFLYNIAGAGIKEFGEDFFTDHSLEDARFSTYIEIGDDDIEELEEEYDLVLEKQMYMNVEEDGFTVRFFGDNEKIDIPEVTEGRAPEETGEIMISEGYALADKVSEGDIMEIDGRDMEVTGFFQRPDYLYMLENPGDTYKNTSTFLLAYGGGDSFDELGEPSVSYAVRYGDEDLSGSFREEVNDRYMMQDYLSAEENMRVVMVRDQADLFLAMSWVTLLVLPLVAVVIICITMSRKVKREQKLIGTLMSMGYSKGRIIRHYTGFAVIPGLAGGIIPAVLAYIFAQPYGEMGLADYEPMDAVFTLPVHAAAAGVIVPVIMYWLASALTTARLLRSDPVELLAGTAGGGGRRRRMLTDSSISFRKKFAVRSMTGNPARSIVILLGIFLGSFTILFGMAMMDSVTGMGERAQEKIGTYEYEYILTSLKEGEPEEGDPVLTGRFESPDGVSLPVTGTDGSSLISSKDTEGRDVDFDEGFFVTMSTAYLYDLEKGDSFTLTDPLTLDEETIEVAGILDNDVQKGIFTSREAAAGLMDMDGDVYNAVISDRPIGFDDDEVAETMAMSSLKEQTDTLMDQMGPVIYLFVALGLIICAVAIFVAVNMLITENRGSISMLKVLGYSSRKIDRIVLDVNHILVPAGILLSIPAVYLAAGALFRMDIETTGMMIDIVIEPRSYLISILLTLACYFGSIAFMGRKIRKVSMVESLKDNRE